MLARVETSVPGNSLPVKNLEALVGAAGWARLPAAVRARFGNGARAALYKGDGFFERTKLGFLWALAGTLFGRPLPARRGRALVEIRVATDARGEVWARCYRFANGAETALSVKHAGNGPWLEERAGALIMRLKVFEENRA